MTHRLRLTEVLLLGAITVLAYPSWSIAQDATPPRASASATTQRTASQAQASRPGGPRNVRIRVSGAAGFTSFTASESFDTVLGTTSKATFGGGAGVLIGRHLFVDVQVTRFTADGERVFIGPGDERFGLGIPLKVTSLPVDVTGGWRLPIAKRGSGRSGSFQLVPYAGGGMGVVNYDETSDFASAGDDIKETFTSYHALGGIELPVGKGLGVNAEVIYRWVPDALGSGGVSQSFGETDLGGMGFRVKGTFTF
jgi:hypothetical protein